MNVNILFLIVNLTNRLDDQHVVSASEILFVFSTFEKKTNLDYIPKIDEIRLGYNSRTFDRLFRHKSIDLDDDKCAFSIFYNNYRDEVHLMAQDEHTRNTWVQGLQYLIEANRQKRQRHIITEEK